MIIWKDLNKFIYPWRIFILKWLCFVFLCSIPCAIARYVLFFCVHVRCGDWGMQGGGGGFSRRFFLLCSIDKGQARSHVTTILLFFTEQNLVISSIIQRTEHVFSLPNRTQKFRFFFLLYAHFNCTCVRSIWISLPLSLSLSHTHTHTNGSTPCVGVLPVYGPLWHM